MNTVTDFSQLDPGGHPVNINDIIDDQLISFVESLNTNLGEVGDEHWQEFQRFQQIVKEREFNILDPKDIAANNYPNYSVFDDDSVPKFAWGIANFIGALIGAATTMDMRFDEKNLIKSEKSGKQYIVSKVSYSIEERMKK